ncbi:molecular chaperone [Clostridium taeniosporum]|uniref:Molecular chaperone n=1 Tax=Clostridium taeniosporum TaxID=394958 RepID=A0A1D7XJH9_9CLOT|nr:molecular chaperone [Clostridium taeniosporum]AOR23476.1 molecular chaperone [Clostridium taeniosporum]
MGLYTYKLYKKQEENISKRYKEKDLILMTTFQLREICNKEKLIKSIINPLDKEELIKLIMKYRGEKDSRLINNYTEGGIERVEKFIKRSSKREIQSDVIDYSGKIVIYKDLSLEVCDESELKSNKELQEGNVLLVDNNFNVFTILNIKRIKKNNEYKYFLVKGKDVFIQENESKFYNLVFLPEKESELIYDIYENKVDFKNYDLEYSSVPILQLEIRELEETTMPLAIDFGTSNTTAGIYIDKEVFQGLNNDLIRNRKHEDYEDDKVKLVKLLDKTKKDYTITPLIPSVVGIKYINENEDNIKYIFAYDALFASKKRYVDDSLTVFYDIKRWISDFEKSEKVIDIHGKTTLVKRKDIIKAYLEYVISLANQRFKCKFKNIYISCPSKQKYKFHKLFEEVLSDYNVHSENMLEESVAVLYNTISDFIDRDKYSNGDEYKALIIDCGGGTTDLSGCSFSIRDNRVSYKIDIETSYENGDTDFGGNNLTFRILQFIKILMANTLARDNCLEIKKAIVDEFRIDIFRNIDKYGITQLYEELNSEYEKAEEIIPTRFKLYETRNKEDYCKVRNNYYFLFNLAEEIKKIFFSNPELIKIILSPNEVKENLEIIDSAQIIYDKWKLSYMNKGKLQIIKEAPTLNLTTYEISTLIKGDVYNIIKKFLETLYKNDELYEYSLIKLTGQSCKVDIFKDALKEFIPGRIIEINKSKKDTSEDYDLKLSCIKGALKYLYSKNFGYADIQIQNNMPTLPYTLTAFTHKGDEIKLIKNKEIKRGFVSRFMDRVILKLYLKDSSNNVKYEYDYKFNNEELENTDAVSIVEKYPNISQHETDNIENDEIKFFVWAEEELWGFYVLAILRKEHELYISKEKFFYFENDKWEKNFFDGMN